MTERRTEQDLSLRSINWIVRSSESMKNWLVADPSGSHWTVENVKLPGIYRSTVEFITYEGLFESQRNEAWFTDGIRSFALLAIELEGIICFRSASDCQVVAVVPSGDAFTIDEFLDGQSLSFRHDPEFADLEWDAVSAAGHILQEYNPYS